MDLDRARGDAALTALGEQLKLVGERFELVAIGGSGLLALGLIDRTTRDELYALVDHAPGSKHDLDLRQLEPSRDELLAAARWAITHDPSEGFRLELTGALTYLGVEDVDLGA